VLEFNKNPSRDGHFLQPALTKAAAMKMAMDTDFKATFTGSVWATPLYFANGPGGKGIFIVVTTGNDVFALDETTGAQVWTKNLGTPPTKSGCQGNGISPLGILSTPVIDAKTGTLYVAGTIGDATALTQHYFTALNLADGTVKPGYPINISTTLNFPAGPHNQRSALSMAGSIVYVAYGGHVGDCGNYHGRVVAIDTSMNPPAVKGWASTGMGEGIWATGGMASSGDGVFVITGNVTGGTPSTHDDSEQVMHVRGMATFDKTGSKDYFYPADWADKDRSDWDFGAINPLLVNLPGSAAPVVVAVTKDGNGFLLDSSNLGGTKAIAEFDVAGQGMSTHGVPTAYKAGTTTFYALPVEMKALGCPSGSGSGAVVMGFALSPTAPLKPSVMWCKSYTSTVYPALISTTTDGSSDAMVWYIDGGTKLMGIDGMTGQAVFNGGTDTCATVQKWSAPIAVKGRVVVAAKGKLCSWSPH